MENLDKNSTKKVKSDKNSVEEREEKLPQTEKPENEQEANRKEAAIGDNMSEATDEATTGEATGNDDGHGEPAVDVDALVAEAEQRGYLRGRNERIEELMSVPAEPEMFGAAGYDCGDESSPMILNRIRTSIWDR